MRSTKLLPSTNFSRLKKWYKISEISNVKTIIKNNSHTQCYSPSQPRMYLYAKRRNDSIFAYFHLFDINSAWFVIQNLKNFPKRIVIAFSIFLFGAQCTFPLSSPPPRVRFHFQFYLFAILSVNIENNFTINWKQFRSIYVYSSTIQSRMPKKETQIMRHTARARTHSWNADVLAFGISVYLRTCTLYSVHYIFGYDKTVLCRFSKCTHKFHFAFLPCHSESVCLSVFFLTFFHAHSHQNITEIYVYIFHFLVYICFILLYFVCVWLGFKYSRLSETVSIGKEKLFRMANRRLANNWTVAIMSADCVDTVVYRPRGELGLKIMINPIQSYSVCMYLYALK